MARFDVHRRKGDGLLVLDCQANILRDIATRFVVPLAPAGTVQRKFEKLNPVFEIGGEAYVMMTQTAAAIPVSRIGERVTSLADEDRVIMNAIDMLLAGY